MANLFNVVEFFTVHISSLSLTLDNMCVDFIYIFNEDSDE